MLEDLLAARLGVSFEARERDRSPVPRFELAGISDELLAEFSTRSAAIEAETERLVTDWRAAHQREPTSAAVLRLRQQATLSTRGEKQHLSLEQLTARWRERARRLVGDEPEAFVGALSSRTQARVAALDEESLEALARAAPSTVAERRATFSAADVTAEVHRLLHGRLFADPAARITAAGAPSSARSRPPCRSAPPRACTCPPRFAGPTAAHALPRARLAVTRRPSCSRPKRGSQTPVAT